MKYLKTAVVALLIAALSACATSPTGRKQLMVVSEEYAIESSAEAYVQTIAPLEKEGKVRGSVAIVECSQTVAQLRWLILHPDVRGLGLGKRLVEECIGFCREKGYSSLFLWTVGHLDAATHIYQSEGFELEEEKSHTIWGVDLTEQKYVLKL